jgi:hypothetical protein
MGHAPITVTAHTYADQFDDELDNIAAALDSPMTLARTTEVSLPLAATRLGPRYPHRRLESIRAEARRRVADTQ